MERVLYCPLVEFELQFSFCSQPFALHYTTQTTDHGMNRLTDGPVVCMTQKGPLPDRLTKL